MGKLLIVSAPSGSGKSTIVHYLMKEHPEFRLAFSVSATSRPPRGEEQDGVDYYFLSEEEFRRHYALGSGWIPHGFYPLRYQGRLLLIFPSIGRDVERVEFPIDHLEPETMVTLKPQIPVN